MLSLVLSGTAAWSVGAGSMLPQCPAPTVQLPPVLGLKMYAEPAATRTEVAAASEIPTDDWSAFLLSERHERLRGIALSIRVRRTLDEAELAVKLAQEYQADPSILQDIDFISLERRLERDLGESNAELRRNGLVPSRELDELTSRQRAAIAELREIEPQIVEARSSAMETAAASERHCSPALPAAARTLFFLRTTPRSL